MALTFPSFNNNPATTSSFSFGSSSAFGSSASSSSFPSFSSSSLGSGLFSSSASAPASTSSFSSFSFSNPASSSAPAQQSSFGSSSLFPSSSSFASPSVPSTTASPTQPLSLTSTYSSLPDDVRNVFLGLEKHVRQQSSLADELSASLPPLGKADDALGSVAASVSALSNALVELRVSMVEDMERVESVQREVEADIRQSEGSHRRAMRLAHVGQGGQSISHMQDTLYLPSHFHWQRLVECEKRLAAVRSEMSDVESCLQSAQSPSSASSQQQNSLTALSSVLQSQHNLLVDVSSRISALHSHIDTLRITQTARYPPTADDSRRQLTAIPNKSLDSFGILNTAQPGLSLLSAAPGTAAASTSFTSNAVGWNAAPPSGAGGGLGSVSSMFGAPSTVSSSSLPSSSFSSGLFGGAPASTSSFGSFGSTAAPNNAAPSFGAGAFGGSSGGFPTLPSAPPALTSSISAAGESGQYRTIRNTGTTSSKPLLRKK